MTFDRVALDRVLAAFGSQRALADRAAAAHPVPLFVAPPPVDEET